MKKPVFSEKYKEVKVVTAGDCPHSTFLAIHMDGVSIYLLFDISNSFNLDFITIFGNLSTLRSICFWVTLNLSNSIFVYAIMDYKLCA